MRPIQTDLRSLIQVFPEDPVLSISGAGGKTTLMFLLAEILPGSCIMTTTTKVGAGQITSADQCFSLDEFPPEHPEKRIWVSPSLEPVNGKIIGCNENEFGRLAALCRERHFCLINEADGAARKHIKAPAGHEPVIPVQSNVCFYLAGLDVLSNRLDHHTVHRPGIFSELTGTPVNSPISAESILRLLDHPRGGLKNIPETAVRIAYLTHADTRERIEAGDYIAEHLRHFDHVCISS